MVDVDRLYQILILHVRPLSDDPHLLVDSIMPTLIAAFQGIWDDGYITGQLETNDFRLAPNPYGPHHYPDWPRRSPQV